MKRHLSLSAGIAFGAMIGDLLWGIRDPKQLAFKTILVFVGLSVFFAVRNKSEVGEGR